MRTDFPRDAYGDPRDYAVEARMILLGLTGLLCTVEHLRALDEEHQVKNINLARDIEALKMKVLRP